jgi:hypothetical protein
MGNLRDKYTDEEWELLLYRNPEQVDHPQHYHGKDNVYEAIKVIEAWNLDFCLGNTIKYIARAEKKHFDNSLEDLEKARWYLDRKINQLKQTK